MEGYFKDSHLRADYEDLFREDEEKPSEAPTSERPEDGDETTTTDKNSISELAGQLIGELNDLNSYMNENLKCDVRTFSLKAEFSEYTPFDMALSIVSKKGDSYEICRIPLIECDRDGDLEDALSGAQAIVACLKVIASVVKGDI